MILRPIKTANTIDILISMIINGFVVTGCPILLHLASFHQRDTRFSYLAPSAAFCPGLAPPAYQDIRLYPFLVCTGRLSRGIIPPVTWVNLIPIQNQCQFCMIFPIIPANSGIFHNSSRFWYKFRYGILLYR